MDDFFKKKNCDRCGKPLNLRIMSWFTEETLCQDCSRQETIIKRKLMDQGKDVRSYEGCGFIPKI